MGRTPCCEKVGLKKGKWTEKEDETLVKYIAENGEGSWTSLPKKAGLLRCGKSCRLRWINYLKAGIVRGNISKEEEEIIIKLHASYGNRWSLIASHLPGRTDNEIKNYWKSHLSRRLHSFCKNGETIIVDLGNVLSSGKRRGGHTMNKSPISSSTTITPTNNSAVEEQSQMIHDDLSDNDNIDNNNISFELRLNEVFRSLLSCCDSNVNWDCSEEAMKEKMGENKGLGWELEDIEALLCEEDEMVEASPWLWDASW